eukprot:CAMPEP_0201644920 /NCGR_PEP_ID=MMETSP0493-20130528/31067_1 /ASSEMBLY_ACC=CAM_ASM_000838 /TAXON_ID=420259 /ORGANISM="Thalassiosira gravida, Strain GMp14c1" /LENGTH=169 /DNA_ID=CAMNT_0048119735 /DNA_START=255 /DNA_END=764 /DNA_ORIENTATION=-
MNDDTHQKLTIILSILILCVITLAIIVLFFHIKEYQVNRSVNFEEATQIHQIDYLINLLDRQEEMLTMDFNMGEDYILTHDDLSGATGVLDKGERERYFKMNEDFVLQLDRLHEMMAGISLIDGDSMGPLFNKRGKEDDRSLFYRFFMGGGPVVKLKFSGLFGIGEVRR